MKSNRFIYKFTTKIWKNKIIHRFNINKKQLRWGNASLVPPSSKQTPSRLSVSHIYHSVLSLCENIHLILTKITFAEAIILHSFRSIRLQTSHSYTSDPFIFLKVRIKSRFRIPSDTFPRSSIGWRKQNKFSVTLLNDPRM